MGKLFFLFTLIFSAFLQAGLADDHTRDNRPAPTSGHPAPAELNCHGNVISDEDYKAILKKAYQPLVRTINRPVYFYHYGYRTPRPRAGVLENGYDDSTPVPATGTKDDFNGPVDLNPLVAADGKQIGLAELYFRRKSGARAVANFYSSYGPGLYTGMDPVGGLLYFKGLLLRVGVPAGTRILDMRQLTHNKRIPLPHEDAAAFKCKLRDMEGGGNKNDIGASVHIENILSSPKSRQLEQEVLQEMEIAAVQPLSDQMLFINPTLSSKFDLAILVPNIEREASPEKTKVYGEVLRHFDAVDLSGETPPWLRSDFSRKDVLPIFWKLYQGWASSVRNLPANVHWENYQREQSAKWKDPAIRYRKLTSTIYGASNEHPEEHEPLKKVNSD